MPDHRNSHEGDQRRKPRPAGQRRSGQPSRQGRSREQRQRRKQGEVPPQRRGALHVEGGAGNLPKWLREEIARVTRKDRLVPTLNLLSSGAGAFAEGRYRLARKVLLEAKELSPRATAIRELLGLAAYRSDLWEEALRELRTFRRLAGDTTHMAVEMDCLRALHRNEEVRRAWTEVQRLGASPGAMKEARVVYGAFLLDDGDPRGAWEVTEPKRLSADPYEEDLRQWYVAARAAAALGDIATARRLSSAISEHDPAFAGLDALEAEISRVEPG